MISSIDNYNVISIDRLSSQTKIGKGSWCFIILFYVTPSSSPLKSRFKETATTLSKKSTTQKTLQFQDRISFFY